MNSRTYDIKVIAELARVTKVISAALSLSENPTRIASNYVARARSTLERFRENYQSSDEEVLRVLDELKMYIDLRSAEMGDLN